MRASELNLKIKYLYKKYLNKIFSLEEGFYLSPNILSCFIIFSLSIILLIIYFPVFDKFLINFYLPRNRLFNFIYFIFDPLAITILSGLWVFSKYAAFIVPNSNFNFNNFAKRKYNKEILSRIILTIIILIIALSTITFIEKKIAKPIFNISRPIYRLEHSVASSLYENEDHNFKLIKDINFNDLNCPILKTIFKIKNNALINKKITKEELLSTLRTTPEYNSDSINLLKDLDIVIYNRGNYANDINVSEKFKNLKKLLPLSKKVPKLWLTGCYEDNKCYKLDSTPSGFVMRQILIWFFAFILFLQKPEIRKGARIKFPKIFIFLNSLVVIIILWSRIYGFYHTLFDEVISLTFVALFIIVLLFFYYLQIKQELAKAKAAYEEYYNGVPECFYQTDDNDRIINCNVPFENTFGFEPKRAKGIDIKALYYDPDDRRMLKEKLFKSPDKSINDYIVFVHKFNQPNDRFVISVNSSQYDNKQLGIKNGVKGTVRNISKLVENLIDGFYQVDNNELITYCNDRFSKIFGINDKFLLKGQKIRDLYVDGINRDRFLKLLKDNHGVITNFIVECKKFEIALHETNYREIALSKTNYKEIIVEVNSHYINFDNPEQGIEGTIRELTFGQALMTHSFNGIYVIQKKDEEYIISQCNLKFRGIFGYDKMNYNEFIENIKVKDIVSPEDWDKVAEKIKLKLLNCHEKSDERYYFTGIKNDGKKIPLEVNSTHYPSFQNNPAVIGNIRDISEDIQEKENLRINSIVLTTRTIFHEILNPIKGTNSLLKILKGNFSLDKVNKSVPEIYDICVKELDYCIASCNYLRDVFDNIKIPIKKINLKIELQKCIDKINVKNNITIENYIDDEVYFWGTSEGLAIVTNNLLLNSFESISGDGCIKIYYENVDERNINLFFKDNGTGIDDQISNKIFDIYTFARRKGHQGLGLHIVRTIITNWGGNISVLETGEHGTTFKIELKK